MTADVGHSLLAAIHENPSDEMTWRVLADWLEEHGREDQSRFLRIQRSLVGMEEGSRRSELETDAQRLLISGVVPFLPLLTNSIGMRFVLIPPGIYWRGSMKKEEGHFSDESPRRLIEITRPFYFGVFPVTQQEYRQVIGWNPSEFALGGRQSEEVAGMDTRRFPVEHVTWEDASTYCSMLSLIADEVHRQQVYRLPTEAEWEYAVRGGVALSCAYPWGATIEPNQANFRPWLQTNPDIFLRRRRTTQVGSYLPNGFGLYDMVGNVWEWCKDWYAADAYEQSSAYDPQGPSTGDRRNARGGAFHLQNTRLRCADRTSFPPVQAEADLGFRVVCDWHKGMKIDFPGS